MPALFLRLLGNWKIAAIVMAISITLSAYGGWKLRDLFADSAEKDRLEAIIEAKDADLEKKHKIATEAANRETQLRESNRRLNALLDAEIKDPAYRCTVPASGVRLLNTAIVQSNTGQPGTGSGEGSRTLEQVIKHEALVLEILGECRARHKALVQAVSK